MPSPITYFSRDPDGLGRGPGRYYWRGHKKYKHSKYSEQRDARIRAKGAKISVIGLPKKSTIKHTSDGRLTR